MTPSRFTALRCAELVSQAYALDAPRPMVTREGSTLYLTFAGSRCARDWKRDAMVVQPLVYWFGDGVGLHAGFFYETCEAWNACKRAVYETECMPSVVITGHSLGAAVALLMAAHLTNDCPHAFPWHFFSVVAFGCPRVGGQAWHRVYHRLSIPTMRITCAHDPFAHAPGWWGWRHVGNSLHLDEDGTPLPDPTGLRETLRYWSRWKLGHLDHSMLGYHVALMAHEHRGFAWPT